METNNIIAAGIAAANAAKQKCIEQQAQSLIGQIENENSNIALIEKRIEEKRAKLKELSGDVISQQTILGTTLGDTLNPNEETIAKVIDDMNKEKQAYVTRVSRELGESIDASNNSIKEIEKRIAEIRGRLLKLRVEEVTVDQIMG